MAAYSNIILVAVFVLLAHSANGFFKKDVLELQHNSSNYVGAVDDINVFKTLNPDVQLEELNMFSNVKQQMVYTLGTRMPGDRIVAHGTKNQSWPTPQNVAITLNYPASGSGALVTYVYIVVNQSTKSGRAYIAKGGIHQRSITVIIESYGTTFMNIDANIYGMA